MRSLLESSIKVLYALSLIAIILGASSLTYVAIEIGGINERVTDLQGSVSAVDSTVGLLANVTGYGDVVTRADLLKQAMNERSITMYSTYDVQTTSAMVAGFMKKYPWAQVNSYKTNDAALIPKLEAEIGANNLQADVIFGALLPPMTEAKKRGWLASYDSPMAQYYPEAFRDPDNMWFPITLSLTVIAYNTKFVSPSEVPKSWMDEFNPKWVGKIGFYIGGAPAQQEYWAMRRLFGEQYWTRFVNEMKPKMYSSTGAEDAALNSGEIWLIQHIGIHHPEQNKQAGAPVNWVIPEEGSPTYFVYGAILKDAKHPAIAKMFLDFYLSYDGQALVIQTPGTPGSWRWSSMTNGPLVPGAPLLANVKILGPEGVGPEPENDFIATYEAYNQELRQLLGLP
jgi:iron(III) transport system substrate-binding protein